VNRVVLLTCAIVHVRYSSLRQQQVQVLRHRHINTLVTIISIFPGRIFIYLFIPNVVHQISHLIPIINGIHQLVN
jgi:hypothetical protein